MPILACATRLRLTLMPSRSAGLQPCLVVLWPGLLALRAGLARRSNGQHHPQRIDHPSAIRTALPSGCGRPPLFSCSAEGFSPALWCCGQGCLHFVPVLLDAPMANTILSGLTIAPL